MANKEHIENRIFNGLGDAIDSLFEVSGLLAEVNALGMRDDLRTAIKSIDELLEYCRKNEGWASRDPE